MKNIIIIFVVLIIIIFAGKVVQAQPVKKVTTQWPVFKKVLFVSGIVGLAVSSGFLVRAGYYHQKIQNNLDYGTQIQIAGYEEKRQNSFFIAGGFAAVGGIFLVSSLFIPNEKVTLFLNPSSKTLGFQYKF